MYGAGFFDPRTIKLFLNRKRLLDLFSGLALEVLLGSPLRRSTAIGVLATTLPACLWGRLEEGFYLQLDRATPRHCGSETIDFLIND